MDSVILELSSINSTGVHLWTGNDIIDYHGIKPLIFYEIVELIYH